MNAEKMLNELTELLAENRKLKDELKQEKESCQSLCRFIDRLEKENRDLKQIQAQESICKEERA